MSDVAEPSLARRYSGLVVLPHSVFALPFALAAFWLAAKGSGEQAEIPIRVLTVVLVIAAVVAARTAAMAFNRLLDRKVDAANPRTKNRHLPSGQLSPKSVNMLVLVSSALFLLFAGLLGFHCLVLAPFVLLVLFGYSYTKRFTHLSHFVLGLALALAPGGAWWVLRPEVSITPIILMLAVLVWVAGFDILYSCQDVEFDRSFFLYSVPVQVGVKTALFISTMLHLAALAGFFLIGFSVGLPLVYYIGVAVLGLFLIGQHFLLSEHDLSRINRAFFTFNGVVSAGYFVLVLVSTR